MAKEQKTFEDLVKEAPLAPSGGTVSLVGTLARSSEAGKFVLITQGSSAVTLEAACVKSHAVLGMSVGHTIVRIDVDAGKIPASASSTTGMLLKGPDENMCKPPSGEMGVDPDLDGLPGPYGGGPVKAAALTPFALATPHQAPASTLAAVQRVVNATVLKWNRGGVI